jgi:hypothetical protein
MKTVGHHELAQRAHGLAARLEALARGLVGDQVDIALAVLLLLVGHAVELVGQRAQALGEQPKPAHLDRQLAGLGLHQRAFGTQDVAQVVVLERRVGLFTQRVARDVELDAAGAVLQRREAGLAHHALEHHAAGDADHDGLRFQRLCVGFAVGRDQRRSAVRGLEVVREGDLLATGLRRAQRLQFLATLGDELVVVDRRRGGGGGFGHGKQAGCHGRCRAKPAILAGDPSAAGQIRRPRLSARCRCVRAGRSRVRAASTGCRVPSAAA